MDLYYHRLFKVVKTKLFFRRKLVSWPLILLGTGWIFSSLELLANQSNFNNQDLFLGPRVQLKTEWKGLDKASKLTSFLILAGHADSQGFAGAGTAGEAVDIKGEIPMDSSISDELFWNLKVRDAIVKSGKERGLIIDSYDPGIRNIDDANDPQTNWSVGGELAKKGVYVIEIHFDSYGEYGFGSGLIPAISTSLNSIDESLAKSFGRYPMFFRGGLGAPRRGIRVLEIAKLEGALEDELRNPLKRDQLIEKISNKVVDAFIEGLRDQ